MGFTRQSKLEQIQKLIAENATVNVLPEPEMIAKAIGVEWNVTDTELGPFAYATKSQALIALCNEARGKVAEAAHNYEVIHTPESATEYVTMLLLYARAMELLLIHHGFDIDMAQSIAPPASGGQVFNPSTRWNTTTPSPAQTFTINTQPNTGHPMVANVDPATGKTTLTYIDQGGKSITVPIENFTMEVTPPPENVTIPTFVPPGGITHHSKPSPPQGWVPIDPVPQDSTWFHCGTCDMKCDSIDTVIEHNNQRHPNLCSLCGKHLGSVHLDHHLKTCGKKRLLDANNWFTCTWCDHAFMTLSVYQGHIEKCEPF